MIIRVCWLAINIIYILSVIPFFSYLLTTYFKFERWIYVYNEYNYLYLLFIFIYFYLLF